MSLSQGQVTIGVANKYRRSWRIELESPATAFPSAPPIQPATIRAQRETVCRDTNGIPVSQEACGSVSRNLEDNALDAVTVLGQSITLAQAVAAMKAFADKWDAEDLAKLAE